MAKKKSPVPAAAAAPPAPVATAALISYQISAPVPQQHLFQVQMTVQQPAAQQELMLPVWIPGSYLIREFARHLQQLRATQDGKPCRVVQLDKHRWVVECSNGKPLTISYQVYAHDNSVRTAWLDADRGFFNPTSLCLQAMGRTRLPHAITVLSPDPAWRLATGLDPEQIDARGFGRYLAPDYDTLADSPFELGDFWEADFELHGVPHRFVVATPPPGFDGARLLADTQRICDTQMRFWHGNKPKGKLPFSRYVFMLNAVDDSYGGLEHLNSTALIASRKHLPRHGAETGEDYVTLLGLISHEYFHTWNVKRLRPASLTPYDYSRENYTSLLWFFEGFTSYYDDLLLLRAGCIDMADYLRLLTKAIEQVRGTPGRLQQTVAQSSFEAWTKYYRPDANTANATVSYYTKGALIGLCLDLTLRQEGQTTLDAVMRTLYQRCHADVDDAAQRGMREKDVLQVLEQLAGRSLAPEIKAWVHGRGELPLEKLLQAHGIQAERSPASLDRQWGLRCQEGSSIQVQSVWRDGAAEQAGLAAGDEWLGIRLPATDGAGQHAAWRVGSLQEVRNYLPAQDRGAPGCTAIVARDKRLLELPFTLPEQPMEQWKLVESRPDDKPKKKNDKIDKPRKEWPWH